MFAEGTTQQQALALAAALAQHSLHPLSRALVAAARLEDAAEHWQVAQVTEQAGQGVRAEVSAASGSGAGYSLAPRVGQFL